MSTCSTTPRTRVSRMKNKSLLSVRLLFINVLFYYFIVTILFVLFIQRIDVTQMTSDLFDLVIWRLKLFYTISICEILFHVIRSDLWRLFFFLYSTLDFVLHHQSLTPSYTYKDLFKLRDFETSIQISLSDFELLVPLLCRLTPCHQ